MVLKLENLDIELLLIYFYFAHFFHKALYLIIVYIFLTRYNHQHLQLMFVIFNLFSCHIVNYRILNLSPK